MRNPVRDMLISNCFPCPPMDIFENPQGSAQEKMASVLDICEKLCGADFYPWAAELAEGTSRTMAFFGSAVFGNKSSDIDLLIFDSDSSPFASPPLRRRLGPIHSHTIYANPYIRNPPAWELLVANLLLAFPRDDIAQTIQEARRKISESPFFNGGIGELITYAAYKCAMERFYFQEHEWERIRNLDLSIDYTHVDLSSMESRSVTPLELNERVRSKMRLMENEDLLALTSAAMRRLGVKKSERADLSKKFMRALRTAGD